MTDAADDGETFYEPPCREAARHTTACPNCGRRVQLKTLRYSHVCGRNFDPLKRAAEQKKVADVAVSARMRSMEHIERAAEQVEQPPERPPQHVAEHNNKYEHLLNFLR